jgi:hypothetical protein
MYGIKASDISMVNLQKDATLSASTGRPGLTLHGICAYKVTQCLSLP